MPFRRSDFQNVLLQHLPPTCKTHVLKRLKSYSRLDSGCIELLFEDDTIATCDLLVGADGIKSSVRRNLLLRGAQKSRERGDPAYAEELQAFVEPVWSGVVAYRTAIPAQHLADKSPGHRTFTQPMQVSGPSEIRLGSCFLMVFFAVSGSQYGKYLDHAFTSLISNSFHFLLACHCLSYGARSVHQLCGFQSSV